MDTIIKDGESYVQLNQGFLTKSESQVLFDAINRNVTFEQEKGIMGNKPKRTSCAFGDKGLVYKYANTTRIAHEWFDELSSLKQKVETTTGKSYNFCLINCYEDNLSQIAWHSDSERDLDHSMGIASISLGAIRKFKMKHKSTKVVVDIYLNNGSFLYMSPGIQDIYTHAVLKTTIPCGTRYNITFRSVIRKQ